MVRPKEFDERTALAAAMQVFWEQGYEATSLSDLTARMKIQRPSLYATFGGKKELFEAALRTYVEASLTYVETKLRSTSSVKASLLAYFQGIIQGTEGRNPEFGCLCVNTMVELAPHEPMFADITRQFQSRLTELFQMRIEEGIRTGELSKQLNPSSIARVLVVTANGLSVMMKSKPDPTQVERVAEEILTLLE